MNAIERNIAKMFNIKSEFADQSGSIFKNWRRRSKVWLKVLLGRGPAAHIYSDHYSPTPRDWNNMPSGNVYEKIINKNEACYYKEIETSAAYIYNFQNIPFNNTVQTAPFWSNSAFPPLDACMLYSLLASRKPAVFMEVGSGNSTKFAYKAVVDHSPATQIISIDPCPRAEIDNLCNTCLRVPLEQVPLEQFEVLKSGDILFIDNSHRSFQNSDVTFFFTTILPNLNPGVIYGIHDIFLPNDYPGEWAMRFYNEQYLLMTYLLGGAGGDEILFPVAYMSYRKDVEKALLGECVESPPWGDEKLQGGAFWMIKA